MDNKSTLSDQALKAPKTMGEIARLLEDLNMATIDLQDSANILDDRLRPIKRNEPSEVDPQKEREASTDLGVFINTLITRTQNTNRVIREANNKLEI